MGRIKPPSFVLCSFCSTTLRVSVSFQGTVISQKDRDHDNITRYLLSSSFLKTPTCCCISRRFGSSLPWHTGTLGPQSFMKQWVLPSTNLPCASLRATQFPPYSCRYGSETARRGPHHLSHLLRKCQDANHPDADWMLYFTSHVKITKITFSIQ